MYLYEAVKCVVMTRFNLLRSELVTFLACELSKRARLHILDTFVVQIIRD